MPFGRVCVLLSRPRRAEHRGTQPSVLVAAVVRTAKGRRTMLPARRVGLAALCGPSFCRPVRLGPALPLLPREWPRTDRLLPSVGLLRLSMEVLVEHYIVVRLRHEPAKIVVLRHEPDQLRRGPIVRKLLRGNTLRFEHVPKHPAPDSLPLLRLVDVKVKAAQGLDLLDGPPAVLPANAWSTARRK